MFFFSEKKNTCLTFSLLSIVLLLRSLEFVSGTDRPLGADSPSSGAAVESVEP